MTVREYIREFERQLGLTYPSSFVSCIEEFSALIASDDFRRVFSRDVRLLLNSSEVTANAGNIPEVMIPFMRVEQPHFPDIYAFDFDHKNHECRVVVWADHAVVMDWKSFPVFIQWIREQIAKHNDAT